MNKIIVSNFEMVSLFWDFFIILFMNSDNDAVKESIFLDGCFSIYEHISGESISIILEKIAFLALDCQLFNKLIYH